MSNNPSSSLLGQIGGALYGQVGPNGTPIIDQSGVNTNLAQGQVDAGQQQKALDEQAAMAAGKGPSAATSMLQQQTAASEANTNALAASGGGATEGVDRRNAMMAGANADQTLGGQAATARAGEQIAAMGQQGAMASGMRGQDIQTAGLEGGIAGQQAGLQQSTNELNEKGQEANQKANSGFLGQAAGAVAGAAMFADADLSKGADFREPGGQAHFTIEPSPHSLEARDPTTLREEDNFMLVKNQRTGRMFKLPLVPLSEAEHKQAMAPHGAGPLGANDPQRQSKQMADGDVGGGVDSRQAFAEMVRRAHPGLYRAAMGQPGAAPKYADGNTGGPSATDKLDKEWAAAAPRAAQAQAARGGGDGGAAQMQSDHALAGEIQRAAVGAGGRDSGSDATAYPVPGYSAPSNFHRGPDPEDQPGSEDQWAQADRTAARAAGEPETQATGGYDQGWDKGPSPSATPSDWDQMFGQANDHPTGGGGGPAPAPDAQGGRKGGVGSAIGGALLGFSNPQAMAGLAAKRLPQRGQAPPSVAAPSVPGAGGQGAPAYSDGDVPPMSSGLDAAWQAAEARGNAAKAAREAPELLQQLHMEKMDILRDMDRHGPELEGEQRLLKQRGPRSVEVKYASPDSVRGLSVLSEAGPSMLVKQRSGGFRPRSAMVTYPDGEIPPNPYDRPGSRGNPVDLDDPAIASADDMREADPVDRTLSEGIDAAFKAGEKAARRPGTRGNPVDLDATDWAPRTPEPTARPALAALFPSPGKATTRSGPTDWATAVAEGERNVSEEKKLTEQDNKRGGLDLVPDEARSLASSGPDAAKREAERRTRSRLAVKDLIKLWQQESRVRERPYADADVGPKRKTGALSKLMQRMPPKKRGRAA